MGGANTPHTPLWKPFYTPSHSMGVAAPPHPLYGYLFFYLQYKTNPSHLQIIQATIPVYLSILFHFSCLQYLESELGTRKTKSSKLYIRGGVGEFPPPRKTTSSKCYIRGGVGV